MTDQQHFAFTTSPIKDTKKAAASRKEMTALQVKEKFLQPCPDFFQNHLNAPHSDKDMESLLEADEELQTLANSYVERNGGVTQYLKLCKILNHLSAKFCETNERIIFLDHHTANLNNHPNGHFDCSPDIPAVLSSRLSTYGTFTGPCKCAEWPDLESVAEVKGDQDYKVGPGQLAAYLGLANQARPDKVGLYGLSISPHGYQIQYSDAGGLTTSPHFDWENLVPLASYVYTLYVPIKGRPNCDPTITRSAARIAGKPTWDVTFKGETYPACEVKLVGQPWKRMTWVAQTAGEFPTVIKDSYWAYGRTFKEGELYDLLQPDGKPAPGFVRVIASGDVFYDEEPVTSVNIEPHVYRVKTRVIMGTSGDPLIRTPNIQRFLMAMYDILEAHRWAVKERNIIHRDIGQANIIVNPKDKLNRNLSEDTRPKFIQEVLTRKPHAPPVARLFDMDNAAENDRESAQSAAFKNSLERSADYEHLRHRTGTPRYMARAVTIGACLSYMWTQFQSMPSLPPDLCGFYKDAHKDVEVDSIRLLEDQDSTTTHGVKWIPSKATTRDFQHLPRHDAESVYWVIVVFLLHAIPRGHSPEDDENRDQLAAAWNLISSHEIKSTLGALASDVRGTFFWSPGIWNVTLHRELVCLAPMMLELGEQVAPEYEYLQPPPDPFHLHEALQRILLKFTVQFTGDADIPLNTEESRVILVPKEVPDLRASTEVSLDGQHLQLAGRRSHLSASQGTYTSGHKRKRSESIASDSAASSWATSKPLRWIAKLLRGDRQPEEEVSGQPPEDVVEKRRRKH